MPVPHPRSLAECSSSVAEEELASSLQLLRLPLEAVARRSAVLRMKGRGCSVFVVDVAATMPLAMAELEVMQVSVTSQHPNGRSAVGVR